MSEAAASALAQAEALLDLGRAVDAEPLLRSALADEPGDAEILGLLARSLIEQGRPKEAVADARQAVAADPTSSTDYYYLGVALSGAGDHDAAREAIEGAVQLEPLWSPYHEALGAILLTLDRPAEALDAAERARSLDPGNARAATLHAAALAELGRVGEAEDAIADALRLDPESDGAHHTAGFIHLRRGGSKEAVARYREALRLDPTDEHTRDGLAIAIKARNPLYGQLVRFSLWESRLPRGAQWAVMLAPLVLLRVISATGDSPVSIALLAAVVALLALTWTLEPVMNLTLLATRSGRILLDRPTRTSTLVFVGFAVTAIAFAALGLLTSEDFLVLTIGLAVCTLSVGSSHALEGARRRVFHVGTATVGAAAALGAVSVALGWDPGLVVAGLVLLVGGVVGLWYVRLAS
jgi:Flp pilus assembly protein TadD